MKMVGASLLQSDDDSDVPDLDLGSISTRRRTFFNKSADDYDEIRHRRKTYKNILTITFFLIFVSVVYFLYSALANIRKLQDDVIELRENHQSIAELFLDIKKIRMEIEFLRESDGDGLNSSRPTTELIYDKLDVVATRLEKLEENRRQTTLSMEDVTSRMSRVESKCLSVCQQQHDTIAGVPVPRSREQPRRRQAAQKKLTMKNKVGGTDEIVFRRND